ncbi:protein of unknown function [Methylocaldum szegediense]|uniref:Uncharacterized protein n=1 Tax=Methylocaldum szegediense TaxID=73780 RepID=A0ABM9I4P1_9GAMM|nr:protein of unknown function [Methylocaldum szegediense]
MAAQDEWKKPPRASGRTRPRVRRHQPYPRHVPGRNAVRVDFRYAAPLVPKPFHPLMRTLVAKDDTSADEAASSLDGRLISLMLSPVKGACSPCFCMKSLCAIGTNRP